MNSNIDEIIKDKSYICITGHVKPDGDCIGSCLGLAIYIKDNFPNKKVDVRIESIDPKFNFIKYSKDIIKNQDDIVYDTCIVLDCSDTKRLENNEKYFNSANTTVCIDHHISNIKYADINIVKPNESSTCEVIFDLLDIEKINKDCAKALYTGIVSDTGVFKFSCTSKKTMEISAKLMNYGFDTSKIIRETYTERSYLQSQILGKALLESMLFLGGKCIVSVISEKDMKLFGVTPQDLDGIVDQLILVSEVECAVFLYELCELEYKVSLRSKEIVDVSKIAFELGGGGHLRAAGCKMPGTSYDTINNVVTRIAEQLMENLND